MARERPSHYPGLRKPSVSEKVRTGICGILTLFSLISAPTDSQAVPKGTPLQGSTNYIDPVTDIRIPVAEAEWPPSSGRFANTPCNVVVIVPNIALANAHCAQNDLRGEKVVVGGPNYDSPHTLHNVTAIYSSEYPPECVKTGSMNNAKCIDLMAVLFTPPVNGGIATLSDKPLKLGDEVRRIGFSPPRGSPADQTIFRAIHNVANKDMVGSAPVSGLGPTHGQSGTPVRDEKGTVWGIISERYNINSKKQGMAAVMVGTEKVKALIKKYVGTLSVEDHSIGNSGPITVSIDVPDAIPANGIFFIGVSLEGIRSGQSTYYVTHDNSCVRPDNRLVGAGGDVQVTRVNKQTTAFAFEKTGSSHSGQVQYVASACARDTAVSFVLGGEDSTFPGRRDYLPAGTDGGVSNYDAVGRGGAAVVVPNKVHFPFVIQAPGK